VASSKRVVMTVMQDLQAHAIDMGNDRVHVELRRTDGQTEFAADFEPDGANYRVTDELYASGVAGGMASPRREVRLLPRTSGQVLSLQSAVDGTVYLHGNLASATAGSSAPQDHYGCDLGPLGRKTSCSDVGACCDVHDQCYIDNNCTAASWGDLDLNSKCQKNCNLPAFSCVLLKTPKPGKSSCCEVGADYCGQFRNPGEPTPTAETPASVPRWDGVKQWNTATDAPADKPASTGKPGKKPKTDLPSGKPTATGKGEDDCDPSTADKSCDDDDTDGDDTDGDDDDTDGDDGDDTDGDDDDTDGDDTDGDDDDTDGDDGDDDTDGDDDGSDGDDDDDDDGSDDDDDGPDEDDDDDTDSDDDDDDNDNDSDDDET
jgi:hypothetical protein